VLHDSMPGDSAVAAEPSAADLEFVFRSDRLCLAFCATVGERWRRNFERLRAPDDLGRWYAEAGLLAAPVRVSAGGLARARAVRAAIYRVARAVIAGEPPDRADEDVLNAAAAVSPPVPSMRGDTATLTADGPAALSAVARDAIELLTTPALRGRIRECAASDCGLLFLDVSRPGRRRWCASTACGTRARSAAYRGRQVAPASPPA
jgi:predicted RNA-binding Zn ribbon-like protein